MTNSVNPIPDGYTALTPFLVVDGGAKAIEFYTDAFGAKLVDRQDGPDGAVMHAELDFGHGRMQLSDPHPSMGLHAPDGTNNVNHSYVLYCADVDATFARAVSLGAQVFEEPSTFVTGDRFASLLDPFGHRWAVMTRVEDVPPEEAKRRLDEWVATQNA
ncbi:VOC family protein [Rhodococcus sp. HNM0563]|uniref:VOC family protein n=1 Tax=unclassified Rhodococcus (in: high G+C Gram-positive bacteria) TaxID=192944 RepID=UPI00146F4FF2|nr:MULTISPECIES: VOC family protein [unclassified Rhodococcus (in: high G+C Gram-positive bacteria)]MCK0090657.1 VOC family protein [Rhodococcus sp. F64268]NLU61851.1 VOC family protein [Rhodococcus sp. HNM0563]